MTLLQAILAMSPFLAIGAVFSVGNLFFGGVHEH
jgi:hypothetical protein